MTKEEIIDPIYGKWVTEKGEPIIFYEDDWISGKLHRTVNVGIVFYWGPRSVFEVHGDNELTVSCDIAYHIPKKMNLLKRIKIAWQVFKYLKK